jgi:hypothetical protein
MEFVEHFPGSILLVLMTVGGAGRVVKVQQQQ